MLPDPSQRDDICKQVIPLQILAQVFAGNNFASPRRADALVFE